MSNIPLRLWWISGEGISRQVISADIQRYLGNDATVRPGANEVNGEQVCHAEPFPLLP